MGRSDSSKEGFTASPLSLPVNARLPVTTASVFSYVDAKIALNACEIESVRTYVPQTIATPRTIAMAVSAVRSLRLRMPRMANVVTSSVSCRQLFHDVVDRVRVAFAEVPHDFAVVQE